MPTVKIEFFHDVICSFCFPMSYNLRQVVRNNPKLQVIHRSYALLKEEGDFIEMFGSRAQAKTEILKHWAHANALDTLHRFNIEGMQKADFLFPMSMKPLWAAKAAGAMGGEAAYWDLFDALQQALFMNSQNIEDEATLLRLVEGCGLDPAVWRSHFMSDEIKEAVNADLAIVARHRLRGVPALVINDHMPIVGARSVEDIVAAIQSAIAL